MPRRILSPAPLPRRLAALLVAAVLTTLVPAAAADRTDDRLQEAQELLDAERPEEALQVLQPLPGPRGPRARALLLTSTAKLMLGRIEEGQADLDSALELDPELRQAWLNRAGLDIAAQRYDAALEALETARRLDPNAEDNHLNIGAVLLLQGRIAEATKSFGHYLETAADRAEAHYMVAKNYAGGGYARLGVENLRRAVELDERYRLAARIDPAFGPISKSPELRQVLETDTYEPPAGYLRAEHTFGGSFDGGDGPLLSATLEALRTLGESFDPRVEVAPSWAVIHGERVRLELSDEGAPDGGGRLQLSAPPEAFTPQAWSARTEEIFRQVQIGLIRRQRPQEDRDAGGGQDGR